MINNLGYADDTALISGNLDHLKILINTVKETSQKAGLRLTLFGPRDLRHAKSNVG